MKDIKSILIGFLLATCMFLFMGNTSSGQVGKYQGFADENNVFMIDTKTGQLFEQKCDGYCRLGKYFLGEDIAPNDFRD